MKVFSKISDCKKGFRLVPGDYPGWGQVGSQPNIADTDKCGKLCKDNPFCRSYEYSNTKRQCNLNAVAAAPSQGIYEDYAFCVSGDFEREHLSQAFFINFC